MKITKIKLDVLKENPKNPRKSTNNQINLYKNLLDRFGCVFPIIVDTNNYVVSDYAKVEAAKILGLTEIECIYIENLTENEIQTIRIGEARAIELGEWDYQKLFEELTKLGENLELTGFNLDEIEALLPGEILDENEIKEIDIPDVEEKYFSKQGDIWLLGKHKLMCGDSTNLEDVKKLVANETMDLMVTDPPYNSETKAFRGAWEETGFKISQCLIWVKNQFVLSRQDYNWRHEPCLYGWKEGAAHYFIKDFTQDTVIEKDLKAIENYSKKELINILKQILREQESIIRENKPLVNDVHPTMKPIRLIARLIHNSSKKDWNILDLFGGSGSTLIAAEQLNRKAFLMEYDPKYADVIVKRYRSLGKSDIILQREGKEYKWEDIKDGLISEA